MFFGAEEDDQDFMSPGGSKLGSVFGMDKASNKGGNESLTYTAPKQPKKKDSAPASGTSSTILFATVVHAYKFVDGQYVSQGKLGAAVLGSPSPEPQYHILLYVSKQKQLTNAKISPAFKLVVQANNYASFYDDARQNWSVKFDTDANAINFAKQVVIAKANCYGSALDSVVCQDLICGEGGTLETGDSVEVKYSGWLLTNHALGQMFDTNTNAEKLFRFKVGKGKVVKGWDIGIVGMKKSGKRLLVVPPTLGYGSQGITNKIPPNSTLLFEVDVVRVKLSKFDSPQQSPTPTPLPNSLPAVDSDGGDETTVKERSKSISEQLSQSPNTGKAKLISRMAKMGQPMLPMAGAIVAQTDSDDESVQESPASPKPQPPVKPVIQPAAQPVTQPPPQISATPISHPVSQVFAQPMSQPAFLQNLPAAQQLAVFQPQNFIQQQQAAMLQQQQLQLQPSSFQPQGAMGLQQPPVYGTAFPQQTFPGASNLPSDVNTPVLLSETRQQNTEVRLSLSKVTDKMDRIIEKIEHLESHNMNSLALQPSAPTMETSVLLFNIQRLVQENERFKKDIFEKSSKIESQNEKISELLQKNQMYVEKSQTFMEERNEGFKNTASQSQARVLSLEQDKVQLARDLCTATSQISSLQMEVTSLKKNGAELRQQLESTTNTSRRDLDELDKLRQQKMEDDGRMMDMTASLREMKQLKKVTESKMVQIQEEYQEVKNTNESLSKNLSDRKRKTAEERRKLEEEMEDMKINFEQEITSLREKLRRQKTSTNTVNAEQVAQVEEDITQEWKTKTDKLLAVAHEKHGRIVQEMQEEKVDLNRKILEFEKKVQSLRSMTGSSEEKIMILQDELDEMSLWKDKYENLRNQATSMKERYEDRLKQLMEEREGVEEEKGQVEAEKDRILERARQLQQQLQQQQSTQQAPAEPAVTPSVVDEVKKIMNTVYRQIRGEIESDESYTGAEILSVVLNTIKTTTLNLVKRQTSEVSSKGGESEEESEEEEEVVEKEETLLPPVLAVKNIPDNISQALSQSEEVVAVVDSSDENDEEQSELTRPVQTEVDIAESAPAPAERESLDDKANQQTEEAVSISNSELLESFTQVDVSSIEQLEEPFMQVQVDTAIDEQLEETFTPINVLSNESLGVPIQEAPVQDKNVWKENSQSDFVAKEIISQSKDLPDEAVKNDLPDEADKNDLPDEADKNDLPDEADKNDLPDEADKNDLPDEADKNDLPDEDDKNDLPDEADKNDIPNEADKNIDLPEVNQLLKTGAIEDNSGTNSDINSNSDIDQSSITDEVSTEQSGKMSPTGEFNSLSDSLTKQPPPLLEEPEKNTENSSLFSDDDTVEDMFGTDFKTNGEDEEIDKTGSKLPSKSELVSEDDLKPKPPPPLFGDDDDDDDDLDWLS